MTVFAQTGGQRTVEVASPIDTSEFDLITSALGSTTTLESFVATNTTGGPLTFDLIYDTGGVIVYVFKDYEVLSHDTFQFTDHNLPVPAGAAIRARAGGVGMQFSAVHLRNHSSIKG